jgi:hypothetical protein
MGRGPVVEIVEAVAEAKGTDPTDLSYSLQEHIDTEALQLLAAHSGSTWTLSFTLPEHEVTVTSDGVVRVHEKQEINL